MSILLHENSPRSTDSDSEGSLKDFIVEEIEYFDDDDKLEFPFDPKYLEPGAKRVRKQRFDLTDSIEILRAEALAFIEKQEKYIFVVAQSISSQKDWTTETLTTFVRTTKNKKFLQDFVVHCEYHTD